MLDKALTYAVHNESSIQIGQIVNVSVRGKTAYGLVIEVRVTPPAKVMLKEAIPLPFQVDKSFVAFILSVSKYTLMPMGWVWRMVMGGVDLRKLELVKNDSAPRLNYQLHALTPHQKEAFDAINISLCKSLYGSFLLDGITGSGKTEVYFHAIAEALKKGKQSLILLPEIGLSYIWLQRFEAQFGFMPLLWHSHTTPKKRLHTWSKAMSGEPHVFVGARSALFLPYKNLGLMIVDEEHDGSYKQEEQGSYHARDMAILRAHHTQIPIVLASATPSLETWANVEQGKSMHLTLPSRFGEATLPSVQLIDRRQQQQKKGWLSDMLRHALNVQFERGQQSLLFLNRRGYAPITLCASCGHQFECPGCSSSLVQHRHTRGITLQCHHCGFVKPLDSQCPECLNHDSLVPCGPGIDRVMEDMTTFFPKARLASLTSDMSPKQQNAVWDAIHAQEIDCVIGTQLIAKGHHVPNLTLVGIIDGDMGLVGGDLRGSEKAFQLLQQVGGRAGRDVKPGTVLIQTYQPENPLFQALCRHDRDGFLRSERHLRQTMSLPPYGRLVSLLITGIRENDVLQHAKQLANHLRSTETVQVLGPAPALMLRLKSRYRYRILLKADRRLNVGDWLRQKLAMIKTPSTLTLTIDVDPMSFN